MKPKKTDADLCEKGLHPFAGDNVYVVPSTGSRTCRQCRIDRKKAYYLERKLEVQATNNRNRWAKYGVTVEQVEAAQKKQKGKCLICKRERPLVVDHCHTGLRFRGLLCKQCNTALGLMDDNPKLGQAMVDYLKEK